MLLYAIVLSLIAGILNGSYVAFLKNVHLPINFIWLIFSLLTFGLLPWITLFILGTDFSAVLHGISLLDKSLLGFGGFLFGLGMILFVLGLNYVGIAVSFILNIGVGTVVGTLLPVLLLNPEKLFSRVGLFQLVAIVIFLIALIFMLRASKHRELSLSHANQFKGKNRLGILVAGLSGILTSAQGFVYSYALPSVSKVAISLGSSNFTATLTSWALIFNAAMIPYAIFFLIRFFRSQERISAPHFSTSFLYILLMSCFYYGSIVLFSKASISLGDMGSVIAWPILMISIILVSNFWSWKREEWKNSGIIAIFSQKISLIFLSAAIILLTLAGYFNN
jgi:L-rhamnose-H+ transport protein